MRVAVTGGAGYIGSHTTVALLEAGHEVLILDNFQNAEQDVPSRVSEIAGRSAHVTTLDITDAPALETALLSFGPDAVIHFAGLKAVGEAAEIPVEYYRVNVGGSITLMQAMEKAGCTRLVFSSSATVYGDPVQIPIPETHGLGATNPYGRSKHMVEEIIQDWGASNPGISAVNLRYFNPVGAHPSARIGEAPQGRPNNLMPFVAQVAVGQRPCLSVFGDDYDTPDGTGVRDYIHVMDLARAHLAALDLTEAQKGVVPVNVGTGRGYSVLEMVRAFEAASGREVPYKIAPRRPGDVAQSLADPSRARALMGWQAEYQLGDMCTHAWAWEEHQRRLKDNQR